MTAALTSQGTVRSKWKLVSLKPFNLSFFNKKKGGFFKKIDLRKQLRRGGGGLVASCSCSDWGRNCYLLGTQDDASTNGAPPPQPGHRALSQGTEPTSQDTELPPSQDTEPLNLPAPGRSESSVPGPRWLSAGLQASAQSFAPASQLIPRTASRRPSQPQGSGAQRGCATLTQVSPTQCSDKTPCRAGSHDCRSACDPLGTHSRNLPEPRTGPPPQSGQEPTPCAHPRRPPYHDLHGAPA